MAHVGACPHESQVFVPQLPQLCDVPGVQTGTDGHEQGPQMPSDRVTPGAEIQVWVPYVLHASVVPSGHVLSEARPPSASAGKYEDAMQWRTETLATTTLPIRPSVGTSLEIMRSGAHPIEPGVCDPDGACSS